MFKFVALCALIVCTQAAPTDKPIEIDSTVADVGFIVTDKPLSHDHEIVSVKTLPTEKRDKREDDSVSLPTNDNKRTPALSQPDYQENKPPTFVHPVPVDQIIKNSNASPQIHSKHGEEETEEREEAVEPAEHTVEENVKSTNESDDAEQQPKSKPRRVYHKHTIKTDSEVHDDSDNREES
ncbi:uncharacterized protein LOC119083727 isoform X2 [Bradysia coprophila]|uniref:uncharacterized protein LOC119083727 isoform X2 n=1 Tax=Bradysia coprophila TaxID=38358 RepID=UPI00187D9694|nr:uncharacterized protein LOC119083727 isoform X2 [Bradysia coprophila]